jgi:hypothetical protein
LKNRILDLILKIGGIKKMNTKTFFGIIGVSMAITFLIGSEGRAEPGEVAKSPMITHSFAVDKGYNGYIWKIYIEAEDPDGDMLRIASVVDQVGTGHYPTDWIYLRPQCQKGFKGYIQWNTFSSNTTYIPEWSQITLRVSIIDKAGNESNVVVFPFTFESGVKDQYRYKMPAPFNDGDVSKLGNILIDLYPPGGSYGGAGPQR